MSPEFREPDSESDISFESFVDLMQEWSVKPWNDDEGLAAFCQAFLSMLPPNMEAVYQNGVDELYELIPDGEISLPGYQFILTVGNYLEDTNDPAAIDSRTSVSESYKARKLYHSIRFVAYLMQDERLMKILFDDRERQRPQPKHIYPEGYEQPEAFEDLITIIMDNPELGGYLATALDIFPIRTTWADRYIVPRQELLKKFGDKPIRLGSVGVGLAAGEKALVTNTPFSDVEIMHAPGGPGQVPRIDETRTEQINSSKAEELNIIEILGFDLLGINDIAEEVFIKASLLLREHKDEELMRDYEKLAHLRDPRLNFNIVDFTNQEAVDDFIENYTHKYGEPPRLDVFLAITMFYQLKTDEERSTVFKNMAKFVHKDGYIIIQDSVDGSFEGEYNYVAVKIYPHKPEIPHEVIAYCRDDRCRQIIFGSGFEVDAIAA